MSPPIFFITGLEKMYEGRQVLRIDNLSITRGEILAIVGPSGSGKSTFLRLLNFLEEPTEGEIVFDQGNPGEEPSLDQRRRVTMVFQNPVMLNRSVEANLRFGLQIHGKAIKSKKVRAIMERLGLIDLADQPAKYLSAGEAQRVAMARALLIQPAVLLLDEPTSNLDPYNIKLIEDIVQEENQQNGTTIVMVTHNILQAQRISDCTALFLDGKLVENSETAKFFSDPKNPKARAFVRGDLVY